ncbi:MAG: LETM1 domain-containing protein, partial [Bacteroidota bacterium]
EDHLRLDPSLYTDGHSHVNFAVLMFPRKFLPHSFWTPAQKIEFYQQNHRERYDHHKLIVHHVNFHRTSQEITSQFDRRVLELLSQGMQHQRVFRNDVLLQFKPLCQRHPFQLDERNHVLVRSFCKVFEVPSLAPRTVQRLNEKATDLMGMDMKLRQNNLHALTKTELMDATYMRGLDAASLSYGANLYWLKNWLKLSEQVSTADTSFYLHAMILHSLNYTELKYQRLDYGVY